MIRFTFDTKKFFALMQILCEKTSDLDKLKAVKLMYFIDREYLLAYGRPVLGDVYISMELGPVPSKAYDHLKEIEDRAVPESPIYAEATARYPVFRTKSQPATELFSEAEIKCIEEVLQKLGHLPGTTLAHIAHKHKAWTESVRNCPIDYKLFFADYPDKHRDAFEAMILDQEDRDFADSI
jgi:uncharacterized phage-associated protein